jgi:hypothetical protein
LTVPIKVRIWQAALLINLALLSFASCASAPRPDWAEDIQAVYPRDRYLAEKGIAKTSVLAQVAGTRAIAGYISQQFSSELREDAVSAANAPTQITDTETTFVRSQMELLTLRYTTAWFNKLEKQWEVVAYIDRDEAWTVYEPRFKRQLDAFHALYTAAERERGQFRKALRFMDAGAYTRGEDFVKAEAFGRILHPQRMDASFSEIRAEIANTPQKIKDAKQNASVFIVCPGGDFEKRVTKAFSDALKAEGFPPDAPNKSSADVICTVSIDEGRQDRELGIFYYPSLQAVFTDAAGVLWTFNATASRASAVTPDVAKRRAYTALAELVVKSFSIR